MKMKTKFTFVILILITFCFINLNLTANAGSDFEKAMLKAKKNLKTAMNKSDQSLLIKSRAEFERILQLKEMPWLVNYYIALADYGLALNGSKDEKTDIVKKYTESGIAVINKSLDENPDFADSYILMEAFQFNRWQYEQEKMQDIISQSQSADESASKLDKDNPRLSMLNGMAAYYTPEQFGGGVKISIPKLEKSAELFKTRKEKSEIYPDWGNDLTLGYLALSLMKRDDDGDMAKAKTIIDEAKKINPDSGFTEYVTKEYEKNVSSK